MLLVYILFGLGFVVVVVVVLRQSYIAEVNLGFLILLPLPPMLCDGPELLILLPAFNSHMLGLQEHATTLGLIRRSHYVTLAGV